MKKNDTLTLTITGTTADGAGVGRQDGMAVFVQGAAEGDVVRAHVIKVKKQYAVAKIEKILTPSPDRADPGCPVAARCGGCAFRHLRYEAELRIKQQRVRDAFARIGGLQVEPAPILAASRLSGYRNKAQYPVGRVDGALQIGFYAPRSHRIIDCRDCALQPPEFARALRVFAAFIEETGLSVYDERTGTGLLRHIYLRKAEATGQLMVCPVVNGNTLPGAERLVALLRAEFSDLLKTVVLNCNTSRTNVVLSDQCKTLYGDGYLTDVLCGVKVRLSALSFYQVNREQAQRLYEQAAMLAEPDGKILLDLYCGAGTIGLSMAARAAKVYGAEIVPQAVEDARYNAAQNGILNAEFFCADAHQAAARLAAQGVRPDVVVVDPPRKGLSPELPALIAQRLCPQRVVYVSCDPATLARDCAAFAAQGYAVRHAVPVDLFPRTAHVETIVLLQRETL